MLVLAMAFPICASGESQIGDVDGDSEVAIADVTVLINYLLTGNDSGVDVSAADCNKDGEVGIADVTVLINYLLTGNWPATPEPTEDSVDLGLPSGTQWATHNLGATNPEDCGDYYAWAETVPNKEYYWWETTAYIYVENQQIFITKYNTNSKYGPVDNKTELDPEDDAAYVNWGPEWRMPSREQIEELLEYCTWERIEVNGMSGCLLTGPNGNTMFLPAAGDRLEGDLCDVGEYGYYWSRSLFILTPTISFPTQASKINMFPGGLEWSTGDRDCGFSVRPVRVTQE